MPSKVSAALVNDYTDALRSVLACLAKEPLKRITMPFELFAFHWDPLLKITFPHMHLGFGMRSHDLPIDNKAHIPTGRVATADVIYFLISELHVKPLVPDWEERIRTARQRIADFEDRR